MTCIGVLVFSALLGFFTLMDVTNGACPNIISREDWNASSPTSVKALKVDPAPYVVVHHSATDLCRTTEACKKQIKSIQSYHMLTNDWEDIGYNFLIGGDGEIYEGRGWGIHGAHVIQYNARSIGVCLIGNYQTSEPLDNQLEALRKLISCSVEKEKIIENYHLIGHRQGSATLCPGDKLYDKIQEWPHYDATPS